MFTRACAILLNFATDYFYRLRFINEDHRYHYGRNVQKYEREGFSIEGALFLLGQTRAESGWDLSNSLTIFKKVPLCGQYLLIGEISYIHPFATYQINASVHDNNMKMWPVVSFSSRHMQHYYGPTVKSLARYFCKHEGVLFL